MMSAILTASVIKQVTGLDLARRLLQIRPELPIMLCTGYSNLFNAARPSIGDIKGFAMKPSFTKRDIAVQLNAVLEKG